MENLSKIRKERGYNQIDIANYLNITRQTYGRYESGKIKPDPDTLIKLSEFFDVSVDYLIGNSNVPLTLAEVRFQREIVSLTDEEAIEKYDLVFDGEKVSTEEIKKMLEIIRAYRK